MKTLFRRILHHKIIYVLLDSESKFSPLLSEGGRGGGGFILQNNDRETS